MDERCVIYPVIFQKLDPSHQLKYLQEEPWQQHNNLKPTEYIFPNVITVFQTKFITFSTLKKHTFSKCSSRENEKKEEPILFTPEKGH